MKTKEIEQLIEAAKDAIELSGWKKCRCGEEHFVASSIALANLGLKVEAAQNPQLRLAPEPIPQGL